MTGLFVKKWLCGVGLAVVLTVAAPATALTLAAHSHAEMQALQAKTSKGDASAMVILGDAFNYGLAPDRKPNTIKAIYWYQKAAALGNAKAQTRLAEIYDAGGDEYGGAVPRDEAKAFALFQQAADQGDVTAQYRLAYLWETTTSVPPDYTQAYHWYVKAAEQNHDGAIEALDGIYAYGEAIKTYAEALARLTKDAEAGDSEAQWRLGEFYAKEGSQRNVTKALTWMQRSADQNSRKGLFSFAIAYLGYSKVTDADFPRAMALMKWSADLGYFPAQNYWARNYLDGDDKPDEFTEKMIFGWWKLAAEKDCWMAQESLSYSYDKGAYVTQDKAEAWKWYILSFRSPYRQDFLRPPLFPSPSAAEQAEGMRRANEWLLTHTASFWPRAD